jgi:hypothetical protein
MANNTALFGFGTQTTGAYLYLAIDGERMECKVTDKLGAIASVASFEDGFIIFACALNSEEYADFSEIAELNGCLDKWLGLFNTVKEVIVVNE